MPKRHKRKHRQSIHDKPFTAPQGDIYVSYCPAIEASVPGAPECQGRVIIAHAAEHVFGGLDTVCHGP